MITKMITCEACKLYYDSETQHNACPHSKKFKLNVELCTRSFNLEEEVKKVLQEGIKEKEPNVLFPVYYNNVYKEGK